MVLFYLKKNFCDGWDNLLWLALFNVVMLVLFGATFFLVSYTAINPVLSILILFTSTSLLMIPLFSISDGCARIADFKSVPFKDIVKNCKNVWKTAMLFGVFVSILLFTGFVGIPFYFSVYTENGNMIGLILAALLFWIVFVSGFALQWFMPLCSQLGGGFKKNVKKSFILFFDNAGFTIFLGFYTLFLTILSALFAFLAPSFTGVILAHNNALRLRMYKYDWLEENPPTTKKERNQIPWQELIAEDRDNVGPRDFKSFIFPWK